MKVSKIFISMFLITALVGLISFVPVQAKTPTTSVLYGWSEGQIAYTGGQAQWVMVEAAAADIVIIMFDRYNNVVWASDWSNEFLNKNWAGPNAYAYSHKYWVGSNVYKIRAYNRNGFWRNPVIVTYNYNY